MNFQFAVLIATFVNMKKKMAIKIADFPCSILQDWTSGENPERIDNLRELIK